MSALTTAQAESGASRQGHHAPMGLFFHTFSNEGWIEYQAQVVGVDGDVVLAQVFSAVDGSPTEVKLFQRAFLYSEQCKLYSDVEMWRARYLQESRRYREHLRSSETEDYPPDPARAAVAAGKSSAQC